MKKIFIYISILGLLLSCDKFLDVSPTTNVSIPSSLDDYKALIYTSSTSYGYSSSLSFGGDDLFYTDSWYRTEPYSDVERHAYTWSDVIYTIVLTPSTWSNTYSNIYAYNKVITEVPDIDDSEDAKKEVIAHAKLMRAWSYFHLVNTFGKPYSMASPEDVAIPYIEENNVMQEGLVQETIHQVYENILDDLDYAMEYLPMAPFANSRFIGSKIAATALKAKVLFYMERYPDALDEVESALALIDSDGTVAYGVLDFTTEVGFIDPAEPHKGLSPNFPSNIGYDADVENIFNNQQYIYSPANGTYIGFIGLNAAFASQMVIDLYDQRDGDLRKAYWLFDKNTGGLPWDPTSPGQYIKKNYGARIGVTYPELLLMGAECEARANKLPAALNYLEQLRVKRYDPAQYAPLSSSNQNEVIRWCIDERTREFIGQGHRWWDMRRLWNDPVGSETIVKTRTLEGDTYTLTKERLTYRIPEQIMEFNPDWIQND